MGYYTNFTLAIEAASNIDIDDFKTELYELSGYTFHSDGVCLHTDNIKWYKWETDMVKLSKRHPDVTFILEGEGEERDDIWKARFRNGEHQLVKGMVIFPLFPEWSNDQVVKKLK